MNPQPRLSMSSRLGINNLMLYIFNLLRLSHQEKHDIMKKIIWGPSKVAKIKYSWKLSPIFDQNHITYWNPFCFDFQFFKSHWKHCNIGDTNLSLSKTQSGGFVPWSFVDRLFDLWIIWLCQIPAKKLSEHQALMVWRSAL